MRSMKRLLSAALLPAGLLIFLMMAAGCAETTQTIETQTRTTIPPDAQGDAASSNPSMSADGRYIAFKSDATNLVVGSTNGARSIYVKDTQTGATTRVSAASNGANGNKDSDNPVISGDGRFVAFESAATNLAANDSNSQCLSPAGTNTNCPDIFIKNLESGETRMVSVTASGVQGDRDSHRPAISGDGRFVAFLSGATNLAAGDTNSKADVYLKDMQTGAVKLVSVAADGVESDSDAMIPAISGDGRFVAFASAASGLAPGDTNGKVDVFIKDMQTGALTLVSTPGSGGAGNEASGFGSLDISADGRFVAFDSVASNLVPGDENGVRDIFMRDMQTGAIALVSTSAAGAQGEWDSYESVAISADGRFVAFSSDASSLISGDPNLNAGKTDAFIKDMRTGAISCVSTSTGSPLPGQGKSGFVAISESGRFVVFESDESTLVPGDTNKKMDVFVKDTQSGATARVSTSTADLEAANDGTRTSSDSLGNSGTINIDRN